MELGETSYNTKMKIYDEFYYDKDNLLRCPNCNNVVFYVENEITHVCPNKESKSFEINESVIKNKSNEFLSKIDNIDNKCATHKKDFQYYKDSNYFCSLCIRGKNVEDYLNLDKIILSEKEIDEFNKLIKKSEDTIKRIEIKSKNFIKKLEENYKIFIERNNLLIEYCKGLLKFNDKYEKNFNLIGTIRRISININNDDFSNYDDIIEFYEKKNIIKFNNELKYKLKDTYKSYFESENILKNGLYYLGEEINSGGYGKVFKALSISDKKIVAIKKLPILNNNFLDGYYNESYILEEMKNCEYSVKYIESFKENNYYYIVTELCDGNLRNILNENENGLSIQTIKKIFSQINEGFKTLINKNFLHRDLKPDNILFNASYFNNDTIDYR